MTQDVKGSLAVREPPGNLVQYEEWTDEAVAHDREELDKSGGDFYKVKEGRNIVRFLPGKPGKKPFLTVWQHYIEVPGAQRPIVFNCPRMNPSKQACPACAEADKLRSASNKVDRDRAFAMSARIRVFANLIDRKNADAGIKVIGYGKTVHEQLISIRKDAEGGDFTHPLNGFDIIIEREGTSKNDTEYFCKAARSTTPLHPDPDQVNEWLQNAHDLEAEYGKIPSSDDIRKMLLGEDEEDDGGGRRRGREVEVNPRGGGKSGQMRRGRTAQDDVEGAAGGGEDDIPF